MDIINILRNDNQKASDIEIKIYADTLKTYCEASKNIETHGSIVFHPRTGAPIENPYLKLRTSAGATLAKMRRINGSRALKAELERPDNPTT